MKTKGARQSGNSEDRRGVRRYVFETAATRATRQFDRVRQAREDAQLRRNPDSPRAAIQAAFPENSDMPSRVATKVERLVDRLNSQPTSPDPSPNPRRPNSKPTRRPGTGRY